MCTTSQGDQPFNISWLMDNRPIQIGQMVSTLGSSETITSSAPQNSIQISDYPPFSSILTIKSVTARHTGNYTCQISNDAGIAEHLASLFVTGGSPKSPS